MKVAIYARVSTVDKHQDPETQLIPMRKWCEREGWTGLEYVDHASALDLRGRVEWRRLMDDAARARPPFRVVVVWRVDRAFRSMKHLHDTLSAWSERGIDFVSVTERFDTTSATGRLMLNIIGSFAEYERAMIQERIAAGMDRARRNGVRMGRPRVLDDPRVVRKLPGVLGRLETREITQDQAAAELGVSERTVRRIWAAGQNGGLSAGPES